MGKHSQQTSPWKERLWLWLWPRWPGISKSLILDGQGIPS